MIERHYASFILDATEEIARRAVVEFTSAAPVQLRAVQ
jgi:hypothetical protein